MRNRLLIFCLGSLCFAGCKKEPSEPVENTPRYTLVWADEFNYTGLPDGASWGYETGHVRNNETQFYEAGKIENSKVENGVLTITSTYDANRANKVTSASIITKDKVDFLYGKIEVSAKMPKGFGAWPAAWTLGKNREVVGWPACGEIDIVEWLGFIPNSIFGSLHKGDTQNKDNPIINSYTPGVDVSAGFHTYGIEWDQDAVKFYFDKVNYSTVLRTQMSDAEWLQFSKPHYLLLNLAMGGKSGGNIDYSKFPFDYKVDYVRYYIKEK